MLLLGWRRKIISEWGVRVSEGLSESVGQRGEWVLKGYGIVRVMGVANER
jgi:hypothetical protein